MSICPTHPKYDSTTIQPNQRTTTQRSSTAVIQLPTNLKQGHKAQIRWSMSPLRNHRTQVGRMPKTPQRRSAEKNFNSQPTTTNPTHQYPRRQTQIQSQTGVPDMWQSGTLRPRLLLQKYDDVSLPKRPVF